MRVKRGDFLLYSNTNLILFSYKESELTDKLLPYLLTKACLIDVKATKEKPIKKRIWNGNAAISAK